MSARKYWFYLGVAILAIAGMTASQLYTPLVVRRLTDMAVNGDPRLAEEAIFMGLTLLLLYLVQAVCSYGRSYLTHFAAWHFVADLRLKVYDKLQNLSMKFYHDKQTGQLMSRIINDTNNIEVLIAHAVPDVIVNVIILIGVSAILFWINPTLAFLSLVSVPVLVALSVVFAKKVLPLFRKAQVIMGELNANLQDNISGMKEIQAFNRHEKEYGKVSDSARGHANAVLGALKWSASYGSSVQFLSNTGIIIVIAYGGVLVSLGTLPVADIVAFLMYLALFFPPVTALARVNEDLQTAIAGAERVFEIIQEDTDVKEVENPVILENSKGHLRFDNVGFHYIDGQEVLKNITIDIKPGEIVALVGPTGVGKTTFISLVNRFYDPIDGNIYLDDINIKNLALTSLRNSISNVIQDVFLFNDTIFENIAYGSPGATKEDVIAAAKIARAHEFICGLESEYDTIIGERGVRLSGGQKQRLSIARAVLRNKPILILDEATASVDVETEHLIQEAMDEVMQNRTTIIIAHRLSTIKKADKIIVLNDGVIEDIGTHEELLQKDGLYSQLNRINKNA
ncbi:MAG: ABC transporter ATP-binding protein/permease [Defluviitaleaceae bacterium]|nr:ABC transporter ATP-binding protein/permease [Defluviitaleaceae bacterium]